jgi:HAD superfamily hydrolase (TIGR01509 family)
VLFDADGTLFPSEHPALVATIPVINDFLLSLGAVRPNGAELLRRGGPGMTFRNRAAEMALAHGVRIGTPPLRIASGDTGHDAGSTLSASTLEHWVAEEARVVTAHLVEVLEPDAEVQRTLHALASRFDLAIVTSSPWIRLDACLRATELERYFPRNRRFSAENSLREPLSKPDPAVYLHALGELRISAGEAVAVEDSATGAAASVAAGIATVGHLAFTPVDQRAAAATALLEAGVCAIAESWARLEHILDDPGDGPASPPRSRPPARTTSTNQEVSR